MTNKLLLRRRKKVNLSFQIVTTDIVNEVMMTDDDDCYDRLL